MKRRGPVRPVGWPAPAWDGDRIGAVMSTREGGVSQGSYASMNLGVAVGDDPNRVAENRARFAASCGARPVFLRQVHGCVVARIGATDAAAEAPVHEADAAVTTEPGIACTVQVADCLPVLFAAPGARAVGAAHAGWRGLAGGVLEATVAAVCEAADCAPGELQAWLGACIGPEAFEVGADVTVAFGEALEPGRSSARFQARGAGKWLADLTGLARDRLAAAGLTKISGDGSSVVAEPSRFFSYRRDRVTGRMAAAVWIRADGGFG